MAAPTPANKHVCENERTHATRLCRAEQVRVSDAIIVDDKFEHAIHIGQFECHRVLARLVVLECCAHKWIDTNEGHLNIVRLVRCPFAVLQLFDVDRVGLYAQHSLDIHPHTRTTSCVIV